MVALFWTTAALAAPPVSLIVRYEQGDVFTQTTETTQETYVPPSPTPQTQTTTATGTMTVSRKDASGTVLDVGLTLPDMGPDVGPLSLQMHLSPTGEVQQVTGTDAMMTTLLGDNAASVPPAAREQLRTTMEQAMQSQGNMQAMFPTRPLAVGDTWDHATSMPIPGIGGQMTLVQKCALAEVKQADARVTCDISAAIDPSTVNLGMFVPEGGDPTQAQIMEGMMRDMLKTMGDTMKGTSTTWFDVAQGYPRRSEQDMAMTIVAMGQTMNMKTRTVVTTELKRGT